MPKDTPAPLAAPRAAETIRPRTSGTAAMAQTAQTAQTARPPRTPSTARSAGTPLTAGTARAADGARADQAGQLASASDGLREAFRRHAAGVAVVTFPRRGEPAGFTATSVTSLSHRPPLLSLALARTSSLVPTLHAAETLVVHLLGHDQRELARRFAEPGADRFAAPTRWRRLGTGEPLLLDAAVWLRCRIRERIATGDHWLVVAEVLDSRMERPAAPLIYHDGSYGTFHEPPAASGATGSSATPATSVTSATKDTLDTGTSSGTGTAGTGARTAAGTAAGIVATAGSGSGSGAGTPVAGPGTSDGDLGIRSAPAVRTGPVAGSA
ncbi:flavin reductase family protein [Frankia sp. AiPa1]|uniref:flavin reductase family protein n=1 Tax=Frankia sp. AiPa1 TaxID=573492 RepID=UPI00202AFCF1|nr:flavin reductase family protein [Frankia sp. AiPa1]MCL9762501.1 flavin reductase family protein [Frankia sp. AiPa1]